MPGLASSYARSIEYANYGYNSATGIGNCGSLREMKIIIIRIIQLGSVLLYKITYFILICITLKIVFKNPNGSMYNSMNLEFQAFFVVRSSKPKLSLFWVLCLIL